MATPFGFIQGRSPINRMAGQTPPIVQPQVPIRAGQFAQQGFQAPGTVQSGLQPQLGSTSILPGQTPPIIQQPVGTNGQVPVIAGIKPQPNISQQIAQQVQPGVQEIQPQALQQAQPQFGLAGGEQALQAGLGAGLSALETGTGSALGTLQLGGALAGEQFGQGIQDLIRQNQLAQQQLQQTQGQAGAAIQSGVGQAVSALAPFRQTGQQAQTRQAALSGALGPEAQAQAFTDFQASPGQEFLREQGELGIINQAAALGGTQGGRVLRELTRFGTGLAAQNLAQEQAQLGQLAGQGLQAAGQASSLLGQGALTQGNLISNIGGQRAGLTSQLGGQQLGARTQLGGLLGGLTQQGAGFQQQAGQQAAQLFGGVGSQLAGARIGAGRDIGQGILGTTQGLSQLQQQQGAGLSDIIGAGGVNISNLLTGAGQLDANQQIQLAQLLQALTTGESTQLANLQGQIGQAQAGGILGQAEGIEEGLTRVGGLLGGLV